MEIKYYSKVYDNDMLQCCTAMVEKYGKYNRSFILPFNTAQSNEWKLKTICIYNRP